MPRISAAALETPRVVVNVKDHRPAPPDYLSETQKAEWLAITRRLPGEYFPRESHGLLAAYCQHVTTLQLLSAEIDRYQIAWTDTAEGLQRFDKLLQMRERESRALSSLATRLRISHRAGGLRSAPIVQQQRRRLRAGASPGRYTCRDPPAGRPKR
jgi:hypothetical protein